LAALADEILDRIQAGPKDRLLHLGFGDGALTRRLAAQAAEGLVLGVDPADDNVRQARRLSVDLENVMFVLGSPEEIPWQEAFFSLVLCGIAVQDWPRAAHEISRVTAAGGRVLLVNPPPEAAEWLRAAGLETQPSGELPLEARKP
jgi:ubiquinone/menaquinone biosynthesis C-methylase UbiE